MSVSATASRFVGCSGEEPVSTKGSGATGCALRTDLRAWFGVDARGLWSLTACSCTGCVAADVRETTLQLHASWILCWVCRRNPELLLLLQALARADAGLTRLRQRSGYGYGYGYRGQDAPLRCRVRVLAVIEGYYCEAHWLLLLRREWVRRRR
jgi:hypothetical protein